MKAAQATMAKMSLLLMSIKKDKFLSRKCISMAFGVQHT